VEKRTEIRAPAVVRRREPNMSSTLKLRELKQLCKQNKLKVSGNKAEVEARLEAAGVQLRS
jgi:hypothetical protein